MSYNLDDLRWPGSEACAALELRRSRLAPRRHEGPEGVPARLSLNQDLGRPGSLPTCAAFPAAEAGRQRRRQFRRPQPASGVSISEPPAAGSMRLSPAAISHRALPSPAARNASSFFHYAPTLGRELPAVERLPVESLSHAPGLPSSSPRSWCTNGAVTSLRGGGNGFSYFWRR